MKEAQKTEQSPQRLQDDSRQKEFEDTFKPGGGRVNFGKARREAPPKAGKKGEGMGRKLLAPLVVLLALGAAAAALYFSGALTPALELAGLVSPTAPSGPTLEEREALVAARERELAAREESLTGRERWLEDKIAALEAGQALQDSGGEARGFQETLQDLSEEKQADIRRIGAIYSKMDPDGAASILADMENPMEVCLILYHMQSAPSALLMGRMEAAAAAELTQIMLS